MPDVSKQKRMEKVNQVKEKINEDSSLKDEGQEE